MIWYFACMYLSCPEASNVSILALIRNLIFIFKSNRPKRFSRMWRTQTSPSVTSNFFFFFLPFCHFQTLSIDSEKFRYFPSDVPRYKIWVLVQTCKMHTNMLAFLCSVQADAIDCHSWSTVTTVRTNLQVSCQCTSRTLASCTGTKLGSCIFTVQMRNYFPSLGIHGGLFHTDDLIEVDVGFKARLSMHFIL